MEKERRKFKRFGAFMSVKCAANTSRETSAQAAVGLTRDVSRDGLCVNANEPLERGAMVDIEIDLPDDPRPVKTAGKIVWVRRSNEDEGIDYGIQFVSMDPVDKFRVLDYAYNYWLETKETDFEDVEAVPEDAK